MLITVVLLLFKLEEKKKFDKEVILSTPRGINWDHSNFCIMRKLTDLFCLTILFAKFIMLASFILHFLANIEGMHLQVILQWSQDVESRP